MYTVKQVKNTDEWDAFVRARRYAPFVQSPHYGDFYHQMGEKSWIFGIYNEQQTLIGGSVVLSTHAKRGDFLYTPYGPIIDETDPSQLRVFRDTLIRFARKNGYDFIRISPMIDNTDLNRDLLVSHGFRTAPMHVLAENSWLLDLRPDEETLLMNMKKNHRNLIRRCEREGVHIDVSQDKSAVDDLNAMLDYTEKKHNFTRFSRRYVHTEFQAFAQHNQAFVYRAYLPDGRLDSASIFVRYGNMSVYRHSGSYNLDRKLPTPYLLQWRAIQDAKNAACRWHNFWGVMPQNADASHPFAGITHFKKGFGGFQKDLVHAHDYAITQKYWLNWVIETLRSKKRGFS